MRNTKEFGVVHNTGSLLHHVSSLPPPLPLW